MSQRLDHRPVLSTVVLAIGIWTLLASSTFEEGDPDTQARVSFAISTGATALEVADGTVQSNATNLRIAGRYEDDLGDPITLQRNDLTIDVSTGFNLAVNAVDAEDTLAADVAFGTAFEVLLDIDQDPTQGQFSAVADGTTTLLTVENDGFTIETGSAESLFRSFDDFRAAVADEDEDEPEEVRLAAASYALIPLSLQLARITEAFADDIELNAQTLEGMNLNESLTLTCSSGGQRFLIWTTDAPGTGEGEVGAGDSFELRLESCFNSELGRFVDGTVVLSDYLPIDEDLRERSFRADIDVSVLFISENEVTGGTNPASTAPRLNGAVSVRYDEVEVEVVEEETG